jgi:hypothetical protein
MFSKIAAIVIAAFATPTPAIEAYEARQAKAHAEWNAWNQEKQAKNEILGLESWFIERNRITGTQANIDTNDRIARSKFAWVAGEWKLVGYKSEACIIRK